MLFEAENGAAVGAQRLEDAVAEQEAAVERRDDGVRFRDKTAVEMKPGTD